MSGSIDNLKPLHTDPIDIKHNIFNNEETLNNLFGIILVAIFVCVFEIILYYFIIVPNLNNSVTNGIDRLFKILTDSNINYININYTIDNILTKIFDNKKILNELNIKNEIKNIIKNEIKDEINGIKTEINKEINNEIKNIINGLKKDLKNDFNNELKNEFKNALKNEFNNELNKNEIKDALKNEFNNELKNELNKNVNNGLNKNVNNGLNNNFNNGIDNSVNNELNNNVNNGIDNSVNKKNEMRKVSDDELNLYSYPYSYSYIEYFEQNEQKEQINKRKYSEDYNMPVGKKVSDIIIKVLENNNIDVNDKTSKYIEILITANFNEYIDNILDTINHDEKRIININNNSTKVISFLIILILLILLFFIRYLITSKRNGKGEVSIKVYITSFVVIFIIILFQINFYFLNQKYQYLGYKGEEEIMVYLLKQ